MAWSYNTRFDVFFLPGATYFIVIIDLCVTITDSLSLLIIDLFEVAKVIRYADFYLTDKSERLRGFVIKWFVLSIEIENRYADF